MSGDSSTLPSPEASVLALDIGGVGGTGVLLGNCSTSAGSSSSSGATSSILAELGIGVMAPVYRLAAYSLTQQGYLISRCKNDAKEYSIFTQ